MKTPEEIKTWLEHCTKVESGETGCRGCPYIMSCVKEEDTDSITADAIAYIQQLESTITEQLEKIELLQWERDAAVSDLTKAMSLDGVEDCSFCKNIKKPYCHPCEFEWRGVCEENTKEEGK